MKYANVIVDISLEKLDRVFQYIIPENMRDQLKVGMLVRVPFGRAMRRGYVVELTGEAQYPEEKLKEIGEIEKKSVTVSGQMIELAWWMKERYGCTMNQALKTVLPVKKEVRAKKGGPSLYRSEEFDRMVENQEIITLNEEQRRVADELERSLCADRAGQATDASPDVHLLFGVTGSGKTEIYLDLIEKVIARKKQAIVLIPEISLTMQTILRFRRRLGDAVAVIHSRLSGGERYETFDRAKKGEISVVVGARSAVFTPFPSLGLIIIDEEHEESYKNEPVPKYHARDVAIRRAGMTGAMVLLGSATPSIESFCRAKSGYYHLHELKHRGGAAAMAAVSVADLRRELAAGNRTILSRELEADMVEALNEKRQIMLFINRRGYSNFVSCRSCGTVFTCPHCSVSLKSHRGGRLKCHYCGYEIALPKVCPTCGSPFIGTFGTGTQKVEDYIRKRFPQAGVLRMDIDTTSGKEGHEAILKKFRDGEADILVGTQMIVKGHDIPNVTLVGILAADLSLFSSDYGAAERTFDLLTQAAGRAGRGAHPGKVVIQTYRPDHYSIVRAAAQDYVGFYEDEMAFRRAMHYPPCGQMAAFLITSAREEEAKELAETVAGELAKHMAGDPELAVIGPAEAAVAKVKDIYRRVIYIKHDDISGILQARDVAVRAFEAAPKRDGMMQFDLTPGGTI